MTTSIEFKNFIPITGYTKEFLHFGHRYRLISSELACEFAKQFAFTCRMKDRLISIETIHIDVSLLPEKAIAHQCESDEAFVKSLPNEYSEFLIKFPDLADILHNYKISKNEVFNHYQPIQSYRVWYVHANENPKLYY